MFAAVDDGELSLLPLAPKATHGVTAERAGVHQPLRARPRKDSVLLRDSGFARPGLEQCPEASGALPSLLAPRANRSEGPGAAFVSLTS
jgi:hypothetical protein